MVVASADTELGRYGWQTITFVKQEILDQDGLITAGIVVNPFSSHNRCAIQQGHRNQTFHSSALSRFSTNLD